MFGFIPTADRMAAHRHKGLADFSITLVDIFSVVKPHLNIMDAVVGMEGTGPSQGSPVKLATAGVDRCHRAGCRGVHGGRIRSRFRPVARGSGEARFGTIKMDDIRVAGDSIASVKKRIRPPSNAVAMTLPFVQDFLNDLTAVRPYIKASECKKCRACIEVCPADAILTDGPFKIDEKKCIQCFCCHEMCDHNAVKLDKPPLVRLFEASLSRSR